MHFKGTTLYTAEIFAQELAVQTVELSVVLVHVMSAT